MVEGPELSPTPSHMLDGGSMDKRDLKRELKDLYSPPAREVSVADVPRMGFLMIDGQGDPSTSQAYTDAVESLFSVSYTLKFAAKRGPLGVDYGVMPLEGLWWADDMADFVTGERSRWRWTMMIMQPPFITTEMVDDALEAVRAKKRLTALQLTRFEEFEEGPAAQILHVGPFSEEGPAIERIHAFIEESGHTLAGKHHEIYLTDIRKADPAKWKTIIRQPMR